MRHGQRVRVVRIGQRLPDRHVGKPGHGEDLPRPGLLRRDAFQRFGHVQLGHLHPLDRTVRPAPRHLLPALDRTVQHPAQRQPPDVRRRIEVRHQGLQRPQGVERRRGDVVQQRLEQRLQVDARLERI